MFLKLGPASLSLSSVKFGKGGYAVFRNEHFHFGVAVQELPFWFCTLFRFRGHCHFLVKQTLGIHFRRNPLSRNSWRKRDPVSKEKDSASFCTVVRCFRGEIGLTVANLYHRSCVADPDYF